jgi:hypothetical protein
MAMDGPDVMAASVMSLPVEVLVTGVFSRLTPADMLAVESTCRAWRSLAQDEWRRWRRRMPELPAPNDMFPPLGPDKALTDKSVVLANMAAGICCGCWSQFAKAGYSACTACLTKRGLIRHGVFYAQVTRALPVEVMFAVQEACMGAYESWAVDQAYADIYGDVCPKVIEHNDAVRYMALWDWLGRTCEQYRGGAGCPCRLEGGTRPEAGKEGADAAKCECKGVPCPCKLRPLCRPDDFDVPRVVETLMHRAHDFTVRKIIERVREALRTLHPAEKRKRPADESVAVDAPPGKRQRLLGR